MAEEVKGQMDKSDKLVRRRGGIAKIWEHK